MHYRVQFSREALERFLRCKVGEKVVLKFGQEQAGWHFVADRTGTLIVSHVDSNMSHTAGNILQVTGKLKLGESKHRVVVKHYPNYGHITILRPL